MDYDSRHLRIFNSERFGRKLAAGLERLDRQNVIPRIWSRDWTVWKPDDVEISNRLGWLDSPTASEKDIPRMEAFAATLPQEGFTRAVVLGMGGSSLAPEVFARVFPRKEGHLALDVLDTTEPGTVRDFAAGLDLERTLFLVSSKSGTTAELVSLFCYFFDSARRALGEDRAGKRFAAVTDRGTALDDLARKLRFRATFHGSSDVGGRFSALTAFGLLPAALKGVDLRRLLAAGRAAAADCRIADPGLNPGALLGSLMGTAAEEGMNKLTLFMPPALAPLAAWLEQLVAESTGKEGRGIVPVPERSVRAPESYGNDRLFVRIQTDGADLGPDVLALIGSGAPLVKLDLPDAYGLAGHFFLWEFATAVAGHLLGINPFDQPDVETTKKRTKEILASPATGPAGGRKKSALVSGPLKISMSGEPDTPPEALGRFLRSAQKGDYLAVLAFLPPRPEVALLLEGLADRLRDKGGLPVTLGFGPRYLHSTGQLHKGDGGSGHFLQLAPASWPDVLIPEVAGVKRPATSFGELFSAQSRGDRQALRDKGRRVLRIEIDGPVEAGISEIVRLLG